MLFLLAFPVFAALALGYRYLQLFAPTNLLVRRVRASAPRSRTAIALLALAAALLVAMHLVASAVVLGAPGFLNFVVLVLAWDAIKLVGLSIVTAIRAATGGPAPARIWLKIIPQSTKGWAG